MTLFRLITYTHFSSWNDDSKLLVICFCFHTECAPH